MARKALYILVLLQVLCGACVKSGEPVEDNKGSGGGLVNPLNPGTEDVEVTFTAASCNVLKPSGRCDEMSMDNDIVRQTLAKSIEDTGADIIGFNELDETLTPNGTYSLPSTCSALKDYSWSISWPNKIHLYVFTYCTYSYANGFAYNNTKFKLEDSGYVWLSKAENEWYDNATSAYSNAGNPERTCVWAKMTHIESGKVIWVFVTHLPTDSQGGVNNMARVVNNFASLKAGSAPSVLIGDMNSAPGSAAYSTLTSYWKDGNTANWGTMSGSSSKYYYTVDVFTKNRPDRRIDHIMTRKCKSSNNYHTIVVTYPVDGKPWCPSDHLPVVATITF